MALIRFGKGLTDDLSLTGSWSSFLLPTPFWHGSGRMSRASARQHLILTSLSCLLPCKWLSTHRVGRSLTQALIFLPFAQTSTSKPQKQQCGALCHSLPRFIPLPRFPAVWTLGPKTIKQMLQVRPKGQLPLILYFFLPSTIKTTENQTNVLNVNMFSSFPFTIWRPFVISHHLCPSLLLFWAPYSIPLLPLDHQHDARCVPSCSFPWLQCHVFVPTFVDRLWHYIGWIREPFVCMFLDEHLILLEKLNE